jgi:hypothetical protein
MNEHTLTASAFVLAPTSIQAWFLRRQDGLCRALAGSVQTSLRRRQPVVPGPRK